jgi:hypothetical protein
MSCKDRGIYALPHQACSLILRSATVLPCPQTIDCTHLLGPATSCSTEQPSDSWDNSRPDRYPGKCAPLEGSTNPEPASDDFSHVYYSPSFESGGVTVALPNINVQDDKTESSRRKENFPPHQIFLRLHLKNSENFQRYAATPLPDAIWPRAHGPLPTGRAAT